MAFDGRTVRVGQPQESTSIDPELRRSRHREHAMDILTKKWSETVENSMRYDCLVLSPARQRRKIDKGAGGQRMEGGWGGWGSGEGKKEKG